MPELTVASFNVHAGIGVRSRGGIPYDLTAACQAIDADVIALQEVWAPDDEPDLPDRMAAALGCTAVSVPLARGTISTRLHLARRGGAGPHRGTGDLSLVLLSRKPIRAHRSTMLFHLPFDPWERCLLQAEIDVDGANLTLVGTHFSHLEFGSPLQAAALRRGLPPIGRPAVLLGDMNMWGWTISAMVPSGWRRAVLGKTWPAHKPHHQIDHLLVTPSVEVVHAEVLGDLGSDHRPIKARLRVP